MCHVFISYSRKNSSFVDKLFLQVIENGFTPWIDEEDIETGAVWWKSIEEAVRTCAAFIIVMSPEAEESEWVDSELQMALDLKKPIFPILHSGKIFTKLKRRNVHVLKAMFNYMPSPKFYKDLAKAAPRTLKPIEPENIALVKQQAQDAKNRGEALKSSPPPQPPPSPPQGRDINFIYSSIKYWEKYAREGETNFNGIARLALALEEEGSYRAHREAIWHLRRACGIEPRVKDKKWMTEKYGWTETHHKLLERILMDPYFGR